MRHRKHHTTTPTPAPASDSAATAEERARHERTIDGDLRKIETYAAIGLVQLAQEREKEHAGSVATAPEPSPAPPPPAESVVTASDTGTTITDTGTTVTDSGSVGQDRMPVDTVEVVRGKEWGAAPGLRDDAGGGTSAPSPSPSPSPSPDPGTIAPYPGSIGQDRGPIDTVEIIKGREGEIPNVIAGLRDDAGGGTSAPSPSPSPSPSPDPGTIAPYPGSIGQDIAPEKLAGILGNMGSVQKDDGGTSAPSPAPAPSPSPDPGTIAPYPGSIGQDIAQGHVTEVDLKSMEPKSWVASLTAAEIAPPQLASHVEKLLSSGHQEPQPTIAAQDLVGGHHEPVPTEHVEAAPGLVEDRVPLSPPESAPEHAHQADAPHGHDHGGGHETWVEQVADRGHGHDHGHNHNSGGGMAI